jgi:hypothetical protein
MSLGNVWNVLRIRLLLTLRRRVLTALDISDFEAIFSQSISVRKKTQEKMPQQRPSS